MPSAQRTITIDRPPDLVYAFFTNHANDPTWRPNVVEIEPISGAPVGKRIHQVIKGPGGRGLGADIEITANEPSARYSFQVVAGRSVHVATSGSRRLGRHGGPLLAGGRPQRSQEAPDVGSRAAVDGR
jgi:uncharacterized membrane protein